jgi:hypothetical protein
LSVEFINPHLELLMIRLLLPDGGYMTLVSTAINPFTSIYLPFYPRLA